MELRRLEEQEHQKTRKLWEEVFSDDTRAFLDYYYFIKTKENEIWVIEEDGEIQSMLQLNPYQLQVAEHPFLCRYIIAVATRAQYRSRGYMSSLLRKAMQEMYGKKEPFTFLMPAAEAKRRNPNAEKRRKAGGNLLLCKRGNLRSFRTADPSGI